MFVRYLAIFLLGLFNVNQSGIGKQVMHAMVACCSSGKEKCEPKDMEVIEGPDVAVKDVTIGDKEVTIGGVQLHLEDVVYIPFIEILGKRAPELVAHAKKFGFKEDDPVGWEFYEIYAGGDELEANMASGNNINNARILFQKMGPYVGIFGTKGPFQNQWKINEAELQKLVDDGKIFKADGKTTFKAQRGYFNRFNYQFEELSDDEMLYEEARDNLVEAQSDFDIAKKLLRRSRYKVPTNKKGYTRRWNYNY